MYDLNTIISINRKASRPKAENWKTRHCSINLLKRGKDKGAVILHSAKLRSTGWLSPANAVPFLKAYRATRSVKTRDRLVEAQF